MSEQRPVTRGKPLDLDVLLDFATIDNADVESAKEWWDEHVSRDEWIGGLHREPIED